MPTPRGEGAMFQTVARIQDVNVIGVGLGGATTNIYSVFDSKFVRTVSANLGMSYSICNVLKEAEIENIARWIPFDCDQNALINILANKMIRPTTIPETLDELIIEHAVAREALRLGFDHHKFLARGLRGVQAVTDLSDMFERKVAGMQTYINMLQVSLIGGTGGLLSHAPRRVQSAMMLIDGFQPEGLTRLIQDSVFMFPHLGVLSTVHSEIAYEVFVKDAIVRLGTCIAPRGVPDKEGEEVMSVELRMSEGNIKTENLMLGEIKLIPVPVGEFVNVTIRPHARCDIGLGNGKELTAKVEGGEVGLILDARGRPLVLPEDGKTMKNLLLSWFRNLSVYPEEELRRYEEANN
jgi:hypothetical protein